MGAEIEPALVDSLAAKVEATVQRRYQAELAALQQRNQAAQTGQGPRIAIGIVSLVMSIPLTAIAQDEDPIHQAIEARKGFYQMLAINMGQLAGMAKGDIAYDEAAASRAAANIEALTQYDLPSLFIEGSGRGQTSEETAAKPDIWTNMDDFRAKFAGLAEAATGASEAVKGGADKAGAVQEKTALLPDYSFAGSDSAAGTSVSGIAGAAIVAAAAALICGVGGICRHKKNHSQ